MGDETPVSPHPDLPPPGGKRHHTLSQSAFALNLAPMPIKGEIMSPPSEPGETRDL